MIHIALVQVLFLLFLDMDTIRLKPFAGPTRKVHAFPAWGKASVTPSGKCGLLSGLVGPSYCLDWSDWVIVWIGRLGGLQRMAR